MMENLFHIVLSVVSITLNIISQSKWNKKPYYIKHLTLLFHFWFFYFVYFIFISKPKFYSRIFRINNEVNEVKYPDKKSSIKNINSCTVFQAKLPFNHISICLFRALLYSVISEVLCTLCIYRHDTSTLLLLDIIVFLMVVVHHSRGSSNYKATHTFCY